MSDPFDPVSVHGIWPLVRDPAHPGGIRFADMSSDAPSDCLDTPAGLPDARVEIRLFPGAEGLASRCEAVAEFGGNAVSAAPFSQEGLHAALLVRYDRERLVGDTLDACVAVSGSRSPLLADVRRRSRIRLDGDRHEAAWRRIWKDEIEAVESDPDLRFDEMGGHMTDRLPIRVRGSGGGYSLLVAAAGEGRRIRVQWDGLRYPPDLAERLGASLHGLGLEIDGNRGLARSVTRADADAIAAFRRDLATLRRDMAGLDAVCRRRNAVSDVMEGRPLAILRRVVDGFPVAKAPASSGYAYQVNPVSGHAVDVDSYAIGSLLKVGAIRPAWWSERRPAERDSKPEDLFEASVWVATELGTGLADGSIDVRAAAEGYPAVVAGLGEILGGSGPSPDFADIAEARPEAAWEPPAGAPEPKAAGGRMPKRAKDLALLAAWYAHGLAGPRAAPSPGS